MDRISYFESSDCAIKMAAIIGFLRKNNTSDEFQKKILYVLINLITEIRDSPERWDDRCQFSIRNTSDLDGFLSLEKVEDQDHLDLIIIALLPCVLEYDLTQELNPFSSHIDFIELIESDINKFNVVTQNKINRLRNGFAVQFVKYMVETSNVKSLNDYFHAVKKANSNLIVWENELHENRTKWDNAYKARVLKVSRLEKRLKKQENKFNFVGLHQGFADLLLEKTKEYNWLRGILISLSILTLLPIILESIYFIFKGVDFNSYFDVIKFAPAVTLTFIFIYYFKICLSNFASVKAQIMQIRLRMSLCQFIQSYADYAKEIRSEDGNPLSKFEDIIFSNIMGSEDKMPATFDGIENIANIINSLKPSK